MYLIIPQAMENEMTETIDIMNVEQSTPINAGTAAMATMASTPGHSVEMTWEDAEQRNVKTLLNSGVRFKEHFLNLAEMKAVKTDEFKKDMSLGSKRNLLRGTAIEFNNDRFYPSERFWLSFCAKVGVGTNIFNLYDHDEVFDRVIDRNKISLSGNVRVIEDCKENKLLAISSPGKAVADWQSVLNLIDQKDGYDVKYHNGIITSIHSLQADLPVKIGNEDFCQRIAVNTPIDGYGLPSVYLALLRQVCSNGMIAMAKAFKTTVKMGKKRKNNHDDTVEFALERMFDSFSNDEGFDALIRRINAARSSRLSVREFYQISQILGSLRSRQAKEEKKLSDVSPELRKWSSLGGNLHVKYGLAHLKEMTDKQMSLLETDMTVYEAVNFITEVTSHRLHPRVTKDNTVAKRLHGWVGTAISRSYDLEGTLEPCETPDEFRPLYFGSPSLN